MRIWVISKRTLMIIVLAAVVIIAAIILILSFAPDAAAAGGRGDEEYEMEVLAGKKKELPIYSVDRADKKIALTIDAAWEDDKTPFILDTLAAYDVKATFFLCGFWVEKYPENVMAIAAAGHELGNHTATHPHMNSLSAAEIKKELLAFDDLIESITGARTTSFRAPYGEYNDFVITTVRELGYEIFQWDIDTIDVNWNQYLFKIRSPCRERPFAPTVVALCVAQPLPLLLWFSDMGSLQTRRTL